MVTFANQVTLMPRMHVIVPNFLVLIGYLYLHLSLHLCIYKCRILLERKIWLPLTICTITLYNNFVNNQYLNLKFNDYVCQNVLHDSRPKVMNFHYLEHYL